MKRTINLIPEEWYGRRRLRVRLLCWGVAFALACPTLFGLYVWEKASCVQLARRLAERRAYHERLQVMGGRLEELRAARLALQAKQGAIRSLLGQQLNTLLLAELGRALERGVWLTSLELDRTSAAASASGRRQAGKVGAGKQNPSAAAETGVSFKMRGYAPSYGALARTLPRLSGLSMLRQPRLLYSKSVGVGNTSAVEFEIEAYLRCG